MANAPPGTNQLSLARFAFNIYGSLNDRSLQRHPERPRLAPLKKLKYICDHEITCVSQLHLPLGRLSSSSSVLYDPSPSVPSHHVLIGGKNYLKLLALNASQTEIVADVNLIDTPAAGLARIHPSQKLFNVNTLKSKGDLVACGLTSGSVNIYQISGNAKAKLSHKLDGHKRVVNSLNFAEHEPVLFSGSQDGTIRLWDLRSLQKPVVKLMASQHSDPVRCCQYSPHSRVRGKMCVLSVHDSGALCKFDLRYPSSAHANVTLPERKWTFHTGPALSLHLHPELEYVLTGGRDRKICLWNYGDATLNSMVPDTTLNTYGPVVKIRWNPTSTPDSSLGNTNTHSTDFHDEYASAGATTSHKLPLYTHDFACMYLNDDPSISVFSLARKYVPTEIVTTLSKKPFQNFVWALTPGRKLWTITKLNAFVSYDLDSPDESAQNIMRPLETLPAVALSWTNGSLGFSLVSQETADFNARLPFKSPSSNDTGPGETAAAATFLERTPPERAGSEEASSEDERYFEFQASPGVLEPLKLTHRPHPGSFQVSLPATPTYFYLNLKTPVLPSPKDRPMLMRLSTQIPSLSFGLQRAGFPDHAFPQAFPQAPAIRPPLNRNTSHSTVESGSLGSAVSQPLAGLPKHLGHPGLLSVPLLPPSPYVVAMSLPLPMADDGVYAALASDYVMGASDVFSLSFVCQINARVAAGVLRLRDCQTWRILSVALEDHHELDLVGVSRSTKNHNSTEGTGPENHQDHVLEGGNGLSLLGSSPVEDARSISSDLGSVVGSYNSDSTLTTNYGSAPRKRSNVSNMSNASLLLGFSRASAGGDHSMGHFPTSSHQSLVDFAKAMSISPVPALQLSKAVDIPGNGPEGEADGRSSSPRVGADIPGNSPKIEVAQDIPPRPKPVEMLTSKSLTIMPHLRYPAIHKHKHQHHTGGQNLAGESRYLDNETQNVLNTTPASYSSSPYSTRTEPASGSQPPGYFLGISPGSHGSQAGSWQSLGNRPFAKISRGALPQAHGHKYLLNRLDRLDRVEETSQASQLTKAMSGYAVFRPWHAVNIIRKSLEYALAQGDLIMGATLILLFYDFFRDNYTEDILEEDSCLEVLGLYIEGLRSRELYTVAVQVAKDTPAALRKRLSAHAVKDVEMRFFCCWCKALLSNETSKAKYGIDSDHFGFWYCDECSKKQLNCVYCNEPCKGLTVVESLRCGHHGHFGCFQEWHIEDGNEECPGGCE